MKQVNPINIKDLAKQLDLVFLPSPAQRACKARFWKRADYLNDEEVTLAAAISITNNSSLTTWWSQEGFKEWFLNKDEAAERAEYLYMLWMDKAEELLLDINANHNAIVNLGKVIAQLTGRDMKEQKFLDEAINKMGPEQLRAYIERASSKLLKPKDKKDGPT